MFNYKKNSGGRPEEVPNPPDQYLLCAWPTGTATISVLRKDLYQFPFDVDLSFLFSSWASLQGGSKVCKRCWVRERGQPLVYQQVESRHEKCPRNCKQDCFGHQIITQKTRNSQHLLICDKSAPLKVALFCIVVWYCREEVKILKELGRDTLKFNLCSRCWRNVLWC